MADKIRAVLAGCGSISNTCLSEAKKIDGLEIVGLIDIDIEAAKRQKEAYNLEAVTGTDLASVLAETHPDVVFDCTIPEAHFHITTTALKHGCHVLGEKPLADTMENAREMVRLAQESGKIYAVVQNRRYQPQIRAFRKFIEEGNIGSLTTLNADFYIGAHFGGFRDRMKHVLLIDMAIHTFDQARFISGADPVAVYCKEWNPKGSWYDYDASAVCIFEMSDGIVFTYRGSWCAEGLNTSWESSWRAVGDKGTAIWDGGDNFMAQAAEYKGGFLSETRDLEVAVPADYPYTGHFGVMQDFLNAIRTNSIPETICTDNIKSLAMCFAAVESAETGRKVEVKI